MSKNFLALLIAALISSAAPAQATEIPPTFEFTGNGYGHGVGMSQIGAKARAVSGESATAIGSVSTKYKYGYITLKVVKGAIEVTNTLALRDEYLWGISEVPSSWPASMLEAQAIASRSFALSKLGVIRPSCDCQVFSHISDQNFVGYSKESEPRFGRLWKDAVSRTIIDTSTSLVVLSNGKPAQTYFFSSSGGATQTTLDAWGGATTYTQSVPDSASVDVKLNPRFASWKASSTQELVAKAFLLPDVVSLEILSRNQAGAVTYIAATSSDGVTKKIRGDTFRSRAKLPSPWFYLVSVQN